METKKIISVDMLRGLASLSVAWFHFTHGNPGFLPDDWLKSTGNWGWLGVEIFFVISGFIIPYSLWKNNFVFKNHWYKFILKRIARIDPPYFISMILSLSLWYLSTFIPEFKGTSLEFDWLQISAHFGYLIDFMGLNWIQPIYWSLAIEFQYYLFICLIIPFLLNKNIWIVRLSLVLLLISPFAIENRIVVFYWMGLFVLGISSFLFFIKKMKIPELILFQILSSAVCWKIIGFPEMIAGLLAVLFILLVNIKPIRPLIFLGSLSYSLYLVHIPVGGKIINLFSRFSGTLFFQVMGLFSALTISLLVGWLFYKYIELPSQELASKIRYKK